jgi:transcriptional regulator with XRE-family HTH domain
MRPLSLHEIGEVIRKVRKERGLRLEDLADENISPATVSNIERGVAHVSPEKITYLLEKLDLPMNKLPEMLEKEQEELKKIKFKLLTISTLLTIDVGTVERTEFRGQPSARRPRLLPERKMSRGPAQMETGGTSIVQCAARLSTKFIP